MLQTRSYTVGKTKHMANKKLHGWQHKTCCKQEVTRWQSKTCCKQEDTRLAKQNIWQTRRYTVGKIKYVVNKKLHGWQHKACCKEEVTRLAKQTML
jgi:hypothetical protein